MENQAPRLADAQQNEMLVKRYMRKGDLYVHADLHGASTTLIKNPDPLRPVPPISLHQVNSLRYLSSSNNRLKAGFSVGVSWPEHVTKQVDCARLFPSFSLLRRDPVLSVCACASSVESYHTSWQLHLVGAM